MRVLLIGGGGRESAMAWKMAQSPLVKEVLVSPGNPGMKLLNEKIRLEPTLKFEDYLGLKPDLVVIGPEQPLSQGIVDFFESHEVPVVGPTQKASRLESSKIFCKEIFQAANIPTADYQVIKNNEEAEKALSKWKYEGVVVKVDGLAQGKGVIVCQELSKALIAVQDFFNGKYLGEKVQTLLLEEALIGPEVSAFALCDGEDFVYLGSATDYKRLLDEDLGPNTGGMGTISPSPFLTKRDEEWIQTHIFAPTLKEMKKRGTPFKGFLFVGLMKTERGLYALEFNTRLGDPETQSLLPRIQEDLIPIFQKAASKELKNVKLIIPEKIAIHVVLTADGYPGVDGKTLRKGDPISVNKLSPETILFPAGVTENTQGLVTNGGRVLGLTVTGENLKVIREKIYLEVEKVKFAGKHYRKDIGQAFL